MAKKRSVFDIDFQPEAPAPEPAPETKSMPSRRGPMASAISENADALDERASQEAAIRAENDALAHEHVRLKRLGLITDLIDVERVRAQKLARDRAYQVEPDLEDLKASIQSVGLSNPIRVEQDGDYFELVQGYRRWSAFRALHAETGDARYAKIPAVLSPKGLDLIKLYQTMVDENLIRKDISFAEMAELARRSSGDLGLDPREAVDAIFTSAGRQKRAYIKSFVRLLNLVGDRLSHAQEIPRALGLDLLKKLEMEPSVASALRADLAASGKRSASEEMAILRAELSAKPELRAPVSQPVAKTTLRLPRAEGEARVLASAGRIELTQTRDFSTIDRARLQAAVTAFLDALKDD